MARPGVFGVPDPDEAQARLSREALLERREQLLHGLKITPSPIVLRIAMAALGGMFLLLAQSGALWAWVGAAFVMLSLAGASSLVGAAAGGVAAAIAYFRLAEMTDTGGVFWAVWFFQIAGGALFGFLASEISRKLPPAAFPFLAALIPAGMEQLGSFMAAGNLLSTALTQYTHPVIVRMARPGGMSGVTFVIFVFGGGVAMAVRYIRETELLTKSTLPAAGFVLMALIYGSLSSAAGDDSLVALAYVPESILKEKDEMAARAEYDTQAWREYMDLLAQEMQRIADRALTLRAIDRSTVAARPEVLVWPEAAIAVAGDLRDEFFKRLVSMARNTGCVQVAGYYDVDAMASMVVVAGAEGEVSPIYARREYVPAVDDVFVADHIAMPGLDAPRAQNTRNGGIGGLLSLDANFFRNFKPVARDGAVLVGVCALNDEKVPQTSIRLLVYNAALSGMGVVRCVRNGALVAISPDGAILATQKSRPAANSQLQANVPKGSASTLFLVFGNAFAWLALLGGLAAGFYAASLPEPPVAALGEGEGEGSGPISFKTRGGLRRL